MTPTTIPIASIIIDRRLRTEYGDLSDLDNIDAVGLIEPVILQRVERYGEGFQPGIITNGPPTVEFHLVAGGRRLAWLTNHDYLDLHHGVTMTPGQPGFLFRDEVPEDVAREVELYENIARKQMTWKERVLSIEEIHILKIKRANGGSWSAEQTGRELGLKSAQPEHMLRIARELRDPVSPVHAATSMMDALKMTLKVKEDKAKLRAMELAKLQSSIVIMPDPKKQPDSGSSPIIPPARTVPLSSMLFHGKMEDVLAEFPAQSVDGIYTDWPYAIDMDNIQQQNMGMNVSTTAAEHDAEKNLNDFDTWLTNMHRVLKVSSFCIIWCDVSNWELMSSLAMSCGFRVQRWPFHWVKTHPCQNGSAQYNQTKAVEHAMVLRMPGATLAKQIPNNYWIGTFDKGEKTELDHPFAKPRKLHERVLSDFFLRGSTILDPFAGTGSIPLSCIANGYHPLAVELSGLHFPKLEHAVREVYQKSTLGTVNFT